ESVDAMLTTTFDLGIPQAPPVGLGWWLVTIAGTVAPWHGGGSPGGASSFRILPDHDAVLVSFHTGRADTFNDRLHTRMIEELTGRSAALPFALEPTPPDDDVVGEYASFQTRINVQRQDDGLVVTSTFEPSDDDHASTLGCYGYQATETIAFTSVAPGLFAPE